MEHHRRPIPPRPSTDVGKYIQPRKRTFRATRVFLRSLTAVTVTVVHLWPASLSWTKPRVGWWKNRFPPYYTRIPKAADWSRINLRLIDEELDLAGWDVDSFNRRLDMKEGISYRDMEVTSPRGNQLRIHVEHITNMARPNLCLIKYSVSSINYTGRISLVPILDGNIVDDADLPNLKIWNILRSGSTSSCAYLWTQTRREDAQVCYAMTYQFFKNNKETTANPIRIEKEKQTGFSVGADVKPGDNVTLIKYTAIASSLPRTE